MPVFENKPDWKDEDIFSLGEAELHQLKRRCAAAVDCNFFGKVNGGKPFALQVGGIAPFSEEGANSAWNNYHTLANNPPTEAEAKETWHRQVKEANGVAFVINATQFAWTSPTQFNTGYITKFAEDLKTGKKTWDKSIERRVGGVSTVTDAKEIVFTPSSHSSLMALVMRVAGEVQRTGACPDELSDAFKSVRVMWMISATVDEIVQMGVKENVEQHQRKRHCEMDNIHQVKAWMMRMAALPGVEGVAKPDPGKPIDVVRYALAMGDPTDPGKTPAWLEGLMGNDTPTFMNKMKALMGRTVTKQFLTAQKATVDHPDMRNYSMICLRVRFINGFAPLALERIHKDITEEWGKRGLSHRPYPLSHGLLMDPNILNADALKNEKCEVPAWRDGELGKEVQLAMVEMARVRAFDHGQVENPRKGGLFRDGKHWAAVARLVGPPKHHLKSTLERTFGIDWHDSVRSLYRAVLAGEHDEALAKISDILPATLDASPPRLQKRLGEMFKPIAGILAALQVESASMREAAQEQKKKDDEDKQREKAAKAAANQDLSDLQGKAAESNDGDVTDDLFSGADAAQKKRMAERLSAAEKEKREASISGAIHRAAAEILRTRLEVAPDAGAAKHIMEGTKDGLKARIAYVDLTQKAELQAPGRWAKSLAQAPSSECQKSLAAEVAGYPLTPVVGTILIRHNQVALYDFHKDLDPLVGHPRSIFVPIDVPDEYLRVLKMAASKSLGAGTRAERKERSGVEFVSRCVGVKQGMTEQGGGDDDIEEEDCEEDEGQAEQEVSKSPEEMGKQELQKAFGRRALNILGAVFQHQSKIGDQAEFLPLSGTVMVKTARGMTQYRKGQIHPTVVMSASKCCVASTCAAIGPTDAFVQACGGTPEGIVGGVIMGFRRVIYVGDTARMAPVSEADEKAHDVNYEDFVSIDVDEPDRSTMFAAAVRMLAPYVRNAVFNTPDKIKVAAPHEIQLPPLRTYVYVPLTSRVIVRTIDPNASRPNGLPQNKKQKTGPGSAAGAEPPKPGDEDLEEAEEEEDDGEGEEDIEAEEEDGDDELAEIEELEEEQAAAKPKAKPKTAMKKAKAAAKKTINKPKAKPKAAA